MSNIHLGRCFATFALAAASLVASTPSALAQTMSQTPTHAPMAKAWPTTEFSFDLPEYHFVDGETLPKLHLHGQTLGTIHRDAAGHVDNAILLLHGTGGDRNSLMNPVFSNVLFGPGEAFDVTRYYLILPDDIGHGESSKPSDGLRMAFPKYQYADMIASQHQMLLEDLHVDHLRLILGTSMGCMQAFMWGEAYPDFMDALAPFACEPTTLAGRNRMMRYMVIENIEQDPAWMGGNYTTEPALGVRTANELLVIMGSSPLQMQYAAPTRVAAEAYIDRLLQRMDAHTDANNMIYYVNASRNYNPEPELAKIKAPVLWINSADDYINPPDLGIAPGLAAKIPHGTYILIPTSEATRGHGTHTQAAVWKQYLIDFMARTEPKAASK